MGLDLSENGSAETMTDEGDRNQILPVPPVIFTGVKKCKIYRWFLTQVITESLWLHSGATYGKSGTFVGEPVFGLFSLNLVQQLARKCCIMDGLMIRAENACWDRWPQVAVHR